MLTGAILVARTLIRFDDRQWKRWLFFLNNPLLAFGCLLNHLLVIDAVRLLLQCLVLLRDPPQLLLLALQGFPLVDLSLNDALGPLEGLPPTTIHQIIEEVVLGVHLGLA